MNLAGDVRLDEAGPGSTPGERAESELIGRARQGSDSAWEALVRQHQDHVFRLAYLVLRDPAEAEDAAQEAFIRAYTALDRFDLSRPLRPWLLRIAVNVARNRRRALGRYVANLRRMLARTPEPVLSNAPAGDVQEQWRSRQLWQAVQRLNPAGQEVVYLRYFLDMSEADMAEALAVAPGTVKSRLHRALARLREVVENEFPDLRESFKE
ncbi:MAG: sigma-70 family RNA polymerase sigma factor [Chloroflexi bacterium]|nr:sigma-70 family RNA polymerase sigma factor [Chloroflexota bacterium]MCI0575231.1 sigma-70 family RNA polymerase sigma factor [Chloroflexota bacterium]MCI0648848.1 sigma-70 family RNA polymerase sigma factor [Chloroflexota bacterium]MCI0726603.1 sigma-70 family RNA polymerase sigma factor [Chloroflexota bacterium]